MSNTGDARTAGRVALVGRRRSVLEPLDRSLRDNGDDPMLVVLSGPSDVEATAALLSAEAFDVVSFGRAVDDADRRRLMDAARTRSPRCRRVDGLAPVTPLLVAQVELGVRQSRSLTDGDPSVVVEAVPDPAIIVRTSSDDVEIVRYRIGALSRPRVSTMQVAREGTNAVAFFPRQPAARRDFVSVRVDGVCVFVGDALGRLPLCQ